MDATSNLGSARSLPRLSTIEGVFEAVKKKTIIQLRWPLVILCCYLFAYSPHSWLTANQTHAIIVFYLLTNAGLYFAHERRFDSPCFYAPILLFDTLFLVISLALSGWGTGDFYLVCFLTVALSCICDDSRGLLIVTFLAPLIYGYFVFNTSGPHDSSVYLRLPFPFVISMFYGYFAQVERLKRKVKEREKQAKEREETAERIQRETERHLQRIEALREIDKAINSTLDLESVLNLLLEKIEAFLPFSAVTTIRLFNQSTGKFENTACRNIDEMLWKGQVGQGTGNLSLEILKTKAPIMVRDIQMDTQRKAGEFYRKHGLVSYLGVPLIVKEEVVGILGFYTKTPHDFTPEETHFLLTLAGQAAIAIHNSQLYEQIGFSNSELEKTTLYLERSLKQLSSLYTALTPISAASSTEEIMSGIIDRLLDATGADAGLIRVWDKKTNRYPIMSQRNFSDDYVERVEATHLLGAVDWVVKHGEPIIAPDIAAEPRLKGKLQLQLGLRSCVMLPLKLQNEVCGIIHIASGKLGYFHEEEKDHLVAIARQMSITLENRELFYDLRSSRDELQRANKVKDQFLSVISHELRTPLNLVIGYADTIRLGIFGEVNPEQEKALEKLLRYSKELLTVITSILYATNIGANEMETRCDQFRLAQFLAELEAWFVTANRQQISLIWDYPSDLPVMQTDRAKLDHILRSLIDNAIKFTHTGQVTVSAGIKEEIRQCDTELDPKPENRINQTLVEFKVTDTGIGIPKEKLPTIFEMFSQGDSSETRSYEGVGLGLYIAKHFTALLGGTIEVETTADEGSTFTVKVPCVLNSSTKRTLDILNSHERIVSAGSISELRQEPLQER
jgi:signal transduction histidine kinase